MLNDFWRQFKSGSDIRGVASAGVAHEEVNLSDDVVEKIAKGFGFFLSERCAKQTNDLKIAVGHDSRISATRIKNNVISGLANLGVTVIDTGLSSTPAMFMSTIDLACDGAISITASHHPFNRNGLKFFTKKSGVQSEDVEKILDFAQQQDFSTSTQPGVCQKINYMKKYSQRLKEMIKKQVNAHDFDYPLKGLKIVVDAGNGAGGFYATDVLAPLGADISHSQFLIPDGMFPNHVPNPENKDAMKSLQNKVEKSGADFGIIFDTDVDRCGAVDNLGQQINRNRLIALASVIALEDCPGGTIVTDSITSTGLKIFIEQVLGGVHHRFRRGYRNVINESMRLNQDGIISPLAIETSGHAAFKQNFFLDDGAYLITKIIVKLAKLKSQNKNIQTLISQLKEPKESIEIRLPILSKDFVFAGKNVLDRLTLYAKNHSWCIDSQNYEGVKILFDQPDLKGWFLLRLSVHDPIMPLNIESDVEFGTKKIFSQLKNFLDVCEELNV